MDVIRAGALADAAVDAEIRPVNDGAENGRCGQGSVARGDAVAVKPGGHSALRFAWRGGDAMLIL